MLGQPQRLFGLLLLGHVARRGENTQHLARLIAVDGGVVEHVGDPARGMTDGQRVVGHKALGKDPLVAFAGLIRVGEVAGEIGANQISTRQAGGLFGGNVDVGDLALGADRQQRVKAGFEQASCVQPGRLGSLRDFQLSLRSYAFGLGVVQPQQRCRKKDQTQNHAARNGRVGEPGRVLRLQLGLPQARVLRALGLVNGRAESLHQVLPVTDLIGMDTEPASARFNDLVKPLQRLNGPGLDLGEARLLRRAVLDVLAQRSQRAVGADLGRSMGLQHRFGAGDHVAARVVLGTGNFCLDPGKLAQHRLAVNHLLVGKLQSNLDPACAKADNQQQADSEGKP